MPLQGDQNVALKIGATMRKASFLDRPGPRAQVVDTVKPTATTKELLKKITETGPIKVEINILFAASAARTSTSCRPESSRFAPPAAPSSSYLCGSGDRLRLRMPR